MKVIGVTGGMGSGKSTACRFLAELGARVIDVDRLAHHLYRPGTGLWRELISAFGEGVLSPSGEIDRKKLSEVVFGLGFVGRLNDIVHPELFGEVKKILEEWRGEGVGVAVIDAPLLFEAGWEGLVDEVWVVFAPKEKVFERLRGRFTSEQIEGRFGAQLPVEEKLRRADVVIDNSGDLEGLRRQILREWGRIMG